MRRLQNNRMNSIFQRRAFEKTVILSVMSRELKIALACVTLCAGVFVLYVAFLLTDIKMRSAEVFIPLLAVAALVACFHCIWRNILVSLAYAVPIYLLFVAVPLLERTSWRLYEVRWWFLGFGILLLLISPVLRKAGIALWKSVSLSVLMMATAGIIVVVVLGCLARVLKYEEYHPVYWRPYGYYGLSARYLRPNTYLSLARSEAQEKYPHLDLGKYEHVLQTPDEQHNYPLPLNDAVRVVISRNLGEWWRNDLITVMMNRYGLIGDVEREPEHITLGTPVLSRPSDEGK